MSPATDAADPLSAVRHRAPSLEEAAVDFGVLTDLTGFSLKLAWVLGHSLLSRTFAESGVTPHRFSVLEVIGRNPGIQPTQLAAALALTRPATTLAVDFWEERGCVERRSTPGDRRSFGVFATARGKKELERFRALVRQSDTALTANLDEREVTELRRLLNKIHR